MIPRCEYPSLASAIPCQRMVRRAGERCSMHRAARLEARAKERDQARIAHLVQQAEARSQAERAAEAELEQLRAELRQLREARA